MPPSPPPSPRHFASFAALASHLNHLGLFRIRPELGQLRETLQRLSPLRAQAVVQITGTNGKGSTATFIEAIARAHGLRTGLYTSPHFLSFRERIRLNGLPVTEDFLLEPANRIMAQGGEKLTYFEFVTVLAALVLTPETVDIAIMETGMGGTWDAVTALPVDAVAFTPIGMDHCQYLGDTLECIAQDKAGAMRPALPAFSAQQAEAAATQLQAVAVERGCPLFFCGGAESLPDPLRYRKVPLGLLGDHQYANAGLALQVWHFLAAQNGWESVVDAEIAGLASAFIPGRMQQIPASAHFGHPPLLLDGAHNAHGMAALRAGLAHNGITPKACIFSCLEDKNPEEMAALIRTVAPGAIFVPPIADNPRAMQPETLAQAIGSHAIPVQSMAEALARASTLYPADQSSAQEAMQPVLICGSLYMLGDFFQLRPDCLTPGA